MKYSVADVAKLGSILGIWAHPDDEVFASGGLCAAAISNGQKVILITATRGDAGKTADEHKWPQRKLGEFRTRELEESLRILGVGEHYWLAYLDGQLQDVKATEAVGEIEKLIGEQKIDTVLSFEPQGITGHDDHKAVHRWAKLLAERRNCRLLCAVERQEFFKEWGEEMQAHYDVYFNVDKPYLVCEADADVCFKLDAGLQDKKLKAVRAHESQTAGMFTDELGQRAVVDMCRCECFCKY